jgi:UDP-N-acetylmuramoylalanine--D-glutamate ligase
VAVALNLGEDHIDRHGSVTAYHAAKRNMIRHQDEHDTFVYNADDPLLRSWGEASKARNLSFSLERDADARYQREAGQLLLEGRPLLGAESLKVRGEHQIANALAVALACRAMGLERDAIAAGLRAFAGLPGRYAPAGSVGGVHFIEDSIATRPLAVAAALRATPAPLVWIAGGRAKGASLEALRALVKERVSLLVGVGEAGPDFARAFAADTATTVCPEPDGEAALRCAVGRSLAYLREQHAGRGHVLLAPLAASFDQFRDYVERAHAFRDAVAAAGREATWTASC